MMPEHPILSSAKSVLIDGTVALVVWNIALPWVDSQGFTLLTIILMAVLAATTLGAVLNLLEIAHHWYATVMEPWREA